MLEIVIGYNAKNRLLFHAPAKENTIIRIKINDNILSSDKDLYEVILSYSVNPLYHKINKSSILIGCTLNPSGI